jgi:hypothetical protein
MTRSLPLAFVIAACGGSSGPHPTVADNDALTRCFASSYDEADVEAAVSRCEATYFGTEWRTQRPAPDPKALPSGDLDARLVQSSIEARAPRMRACYRAAMTHDPSLRGEVRMRFVVSESGRAIRVEDAGSKLRDPRMLSCMKQEFSALRFPRPEGGFVTIVYPMLFSPGDAHR